MWTYVSIFCILCCNIWSDLISNIYIYIYNTKITHTFFAERKMSNGQKKDFVPLPVEGKEKKKKGKAKKKAECRNGMETMDE